MIKGIIERPYWAGKIYFSSYGIAWFDLETFINIIRYIYQSESITVDDLDNILPSISRHKFAKTRREGSFFIRLLWHLGLLVSKDIKGKRSYVLSSYGKYVVQRVSNSSRDIWPDIIRDVFVKWYPLLVFLRYIGIKGIASVSDITNDLGGLMKKWTRILYHIGVTEGIMRRRSVAKPYNDFVVRNFFIPLAKQLDLLIIHKGKYMLSSKGKEVLSRYNNLIEDADIIRTMPGDYTIYAGIVDVLYDAKEPVLVSPWINGLLTKLVLRTLSINKRIEAIHIIVRNDKRNRIHLRELLKKIKSIDVYIHVYDRLHAKIAMSIEGPALESSANIMESSLKRNYEVGTYYKKAPFNLALAVEELLSISKRLYIEV